MKKEFKIQRIDGLPKRKVTPNEEDMKRIRYEGKLISNLKTHKFRLIIFFEDFIRPVEGITTEFLEVKEYSMANQEDHILIDIAAQKVLKL